ncbi:hypothetical protein [Butyrivibrio sp. AE3006]|uniref:hypothetical protein n=1 Tax=Butyrivibrio sp. AE3006 TaxID=1280673 RepID=UPI000425DB65|nr:hypothetical protein [Butyrivibrio sp. AE3006]
MKDLLELRRKSEEDLAVTYGLYELEFSDERNDALAQELRDAMEKAFDQQDEDGSVEYDLCATSVFAANMCIASRALDEYDPIFARDCIHAALDSGQFLMAALDKLGLLRGKDTEGVTTEDKQAIVFAFSELMRTDIEIRNAYDHSMMAGMPQKMSRQKKYKLITDFLSNDELYGELSDMLVLTAIAVLLDEEDNATSKTRKTIMDKLSYFADSTIDGELLEDDKGLYMLSYRTIIDALNMVLQKDKEKREGGDSNLIKVIEYNVIDNRKHMSDEEIKEIQDRITKYENKLKSFE